MQRKGKRLQDSSKPRIYKGASGRGGGRPRTINPLAEQPLPGPEPELSAAEVLTWLRENDLKDKSERFPKAMLARLAHVSLTQLGEVVAGRKRLAQKTHAALSLLISRIKAGELAIERPMVHRPAKEWWYNGYGGLTRARCEERWIPGPPRLVYPKEEALLERVWPVG